MMELVRVDDLPNEQRLMMLAARKRLTPEQEQEIVGILEEGFDVDAFINLCVRHKVMALVSQKIIELDRAYKITTQHKRIIDYLYQGNLQRNEDLFAELKQVLQALQENGIHAVPVKGTVLVPNVYEDLGLRVLNDLDFLIPIDQKDAVSAALKSIGYEVGYYNWADKTVKSVSRKKEMMWKMYNGNLYPHLKISNNPFLRFVKVDFSYDVDLKRNYRASSGLLEVAEQSELLGVPTWRLAPHDMLIHIAIHLFKEATNVHFVQMHKDLNLIKFVDLREYALTLLERPEGLDYDRLIRRVEELEAQEAIFYGFYYLYFLFGDTFSQEILSRLHVTDTAFLDKYGYRDYEAPKQWRKSFAERFFSLSNHDEIEDESKYTKLKDHILT